ncbi:hypothetical protein QO034_17765 [Sedimentitalea sp. JM2-8]|uniref:Uncharacterized protein n=1 Tax=Sedimentitalea xiamensis TaxID=3050037 RepID=A0ABT7FIS9_9RHOB|nr:hypothetical protein [Sedimentitalea xiamensis]MDK3074940.1 hypothetical protein [Sedimentitalea xiamensis]
MRHNAAEPEQDGIGFRGPRRTRGGLFSGLPTHEIFAGRPETQRAAQLPEGDGRRQPFPAEQIAVFRGSYADDLMWMSAGADGLARPMDDPDKTGAGPNLPSTDTTRGRPNDNQERRMEGAG